MKRKEIYLSVCSYSLIGRSTKFLNALMGKRVYSKETLLCCWKNDSSCKFKVEKLPFFVFIFLENTQ